MQSIRAPRAILTFKGWPDAGEMVEHSMRELTRLVPWSKATEWDLDGFWQLDSVRPRILVQHGQIQRMDWPSYEFLISEPIEGQQLLLGSGPEPTCNWRRFADMVATQLRDWQCREVILLGSLYDQIFHDEVVISAVVQDSATYTRVRELGCRLVQYQGPGAIHAAIMEQFATSGIHGISLWAHLPFYLKGPSELLMSHFLRTLGALIGIRLDTQHLIDAWENRLTELEQLIEQDRELQQLLEQLRECQETKKAAGGENRSKVVHLNEFLKRRSDLDVDEPA
ncbi:MAG TPA: hypothetical protein DEO88_06795 [Syntrophobacteraceae bacterium]|nr:hypothetical protein [Syntrophobacteraceae bacterium]